MERFYFDNTIPVKELQEVVEFDKIDWDLVLWRQQGVADWVKWLADMRKQSPNDWKAIALASENNGRRAAFLMDPHGWFDKFLSIIPTEISDAVDNFLLPATERILKAAEVTAAMREWRRYSHDKGVWESIRGDATAMDCLVQLSYALRRSMLVFEYLVDMLWPMDPSLTGGAKTARQTVRKEKLEVLNDIKKIYTSLSSATSQLSNFRVWKNKVLTPVEDWDSDTRWLVLKDVTIDLQANIRLAGEMIYVMEVEHAPEHMSTMSLDVRYRDVEDYDENVKSEWVQGIERVLPDPEVRLYLQKRYGAALLGDPALAGKSMVWQRGANDTAKSTIQECIAGDKGVFAPYAQTASANVLTTKGDRSGASERFKAYARGKRFVLMSELGAGVPINESELKVLTGGDTVEGTAKFANTVTYKFTATMFMATNHDPVFPSGDRGAMDRVHVVPFVHKLWDQTKNPEEWAKATEDHRADKGWANRVLSNPQERIAILNWVLDGLYAFRKEGITSLPKAMQDSGDEFRNAEATPPMRILDIMLGHDASPAVMELLTDEEWEERGLLPSAGMTYSDLRRLVSNTALLNQEIRENDVVPEKWVRDIARMLKARDAGWKQAYVDGKRESMFRFTRLVESDISIFANSH